MTQTRPGLSENQSQTGRHGKKSIWKWITMICITLICIFGSLWIGSRSGTAWANEGDDPSQDPAVPTLTGDVTFLRQDGGYYVMQVTVANSGADFSGTVQLVFASGSSRNCAYNTKLVLPSQGKKQYTVNVLERAAETVRGLCALNFLDEQGNVVQSISLKNVFGKAVTGITVGILSDRYSDLLYLDAGGRELSLRDFVSPLELVQLTADNLQGYLDGLYFLVIDQFNVSSLGEENIRALEEWVKDGGWLLIGTGAYAEQTLSGFDESFLGLEIDGISQPGEFNTLPSDMERYGMYWDYQNAEVDFTQMTVARFDYARTQTGYFESSQHPSTLFSIGDGIVSVFYFSFGEKELQKLSDSSIESMYEEAMYQSNSYHYASGYSDMAYVGQRSLSYMDSLNTNVDFGWLEILIGVYVVFVGPVLYLILRKKKKSEWYWAAVPVFGLLFVAGVFFFGQGAQVYGTTVYSVTAQRVDSSQEATCFLAYRSGVKPWEIRLDEDYEAAGPGWDGYYYGNSTNTADYYYTVTDDGGGLLAGVRPAGNFENAYLYAEGKAEAKGAFLSENIWLDSVGMAGYPASGTVTNETGYDLAYLALWEGSHFTVFADVKAGETLDFQEAKDDGRCLFASYTTYYDSLLYDLLDIYGSGRPSEDYDQTAMAALLIGIGMAQERMPAGGENGIIAGVVADYDRASGESREISYGCLYSYAEMGVSWDGED